MTRSQPSREQSRFLAGAKAEKSWFSLASLLESAIATPQQFGFSGADEVLETVAAARNQHPGALRGPVAARRFLIDHYDRYGSEDHINCGYHSVRILAAIHELSAERAEELVKDVLSGALSTRALRQLYRDMTGDGPHGAEGKPGAAARSKRRSVAFARAVGEFIENNVELFCEIPTAQVRPSPQIGSLSPDYLIVAGNEPMVAIETTIPGASVYRKQINETVGLCALTLMRVPQIWIIAPTSAQRHLEKMASVAMSFNLTGAHFACLDESALEEVPKRVLVEVGVGSDLTK